MRQSVRPSIGRQSACPAPCYAVCRRQARCGQADDRTPPRVTDQLDDAESMIFTRSQAAMSTSQDVSGLRSRCTGVRVGVATPSRIWRAGPAAADLDAVLTDLPPPGRPGPSAWAASAPRLLHHQEQVAGLDEHVDRSGPGSGGPACARVASRANRR